MFAGNTADPATVAAQSDKLKQRFGLRRVAGDGGTLTQAQIDQTLRPAGLDSITALRALAIQAFVAENGPLQMSL